MLYEVALLDPVQVIVFEASPGVTVTPVGAAGAVGAVTDLSSGLHDASNMSAGNTNARLRLRSQRITLPPDIGSPCSQSAYSAATLCAGPNPSVGASDCRNTCGSGQKPAAPEAGFLS